MVVRPSGGKWGRGSQVRSHSPRATSHLIGVLALRLIMLSTGERQVSGCFSGGFEKGFVINRVTYPFPPFQHSDSDSDPEYSSLPPSIPSAVPVTGESFCDCEGQNEATFCNSLHTAHRGKDCRCGEEDEGTCLAAGTCGGLGRFPGTRQAPFSCSPP